jgi:hypothetical protein
MICKEGEAVFIKLLHVWCTFRFYECFRMFLAKDAKSMETANNKEPLITRNSELLQTTEIWAVKKL